MIEDPYWKKMNCMKSRIIIWKKPVKQDRRVSLIWNNDRAIKKYTQHIPKKTEASDLPTEERDKFESAIEMKLKSKIHGALNIK